MLGHKNDTYCKTYKSVKYTDETVRTPKQTAPSTLVLSCMSLRGVFTWDAISSSEANNDMFPSPQSKPSIRATSVLLRTAGRTVLTATFTKHHSFLKVLIKSTTTHLKFLFHEIHLHSKLFTFSPHLITQHVLDTKVPTGITPIPVPYHSLLFLTVYS